MPPKKKRKTPKAKTRSALGKDDTTIKHLRRDPFQKPDTSDAPKRRVVPDPGTTPDANAPPKKKKKPLAPKSGRRPRRGATKSGAKSPSTRHKPRRPASATHKNPLKFRFLGEK